MTTRDRVSPTRSEYAEGRPASAEVESPQPASSSFSEIAESLREAQAFGGHYIAAQLDRVRLAVRNIAVMIVLGIVGGLAGAAIVVTAAVLLCDGIADGLGQLFGGRPWLGELVTALVIFCALGIGSWWFVTRLTRTFRQQAINAYEQRKANQRTEFGADVHERSEQQRSGI